MNLKLWKRVQYHIRFDCRWGMYSAFFTGVAFFLLSVAYFGFHNVSQMQSGTLFCSVLMPLIIFASHMVLFCGIKLKHTLAYGIVGSLYCVYMLIYILTISSGSSALEVVWYVLAAVVMVATVIGWIPTKLVVVLFYLCPVVYRFMQIDLDRYIRAKDYVGFLPEAAALCGLLAFASFGMSMKQIKDDTVKSVYLL